MKCLRYRRPILLLLLRTASVRFEDGPVRADEVVRIESESSVMEGCSLCSTMGADRSTARDGEHAVVWSAHGGGWGRRNVHVR